MEVNMFCKLESMQMLVHILIMAESYNGMHEKVTSCYVGK